LNVTPSSPGFGSPDANDHWLDRLKAVECGDATYPARSPALVFERALGSRIWDVAGREYIDLCAGFGVLALGHNSPALARALARRSAGTSPSAPPPITHGMGDVYASRAKVELLERLTSLLPDPLSVAALALTGGQAVELAVKSAMLATGRHGFIVFEGSYHGLDLGILPLTTARASFSAPFSPWLAPRSVEMLPWGASSAAVSAAAERLAAAGFGAAAVVVEPIQGRAGVRPAGRVWLEQLRHDCDHLGMLLIYDEVFTGLGRTGRLTFAEEVPCDLLCLGKALGGGLPLSACVGTRAAMGGWPESTGEALHTGTFFGHPLSCEAALATLDCLVDEALVARSRELGAETLARLARDLRDHAAVRAVRGDGLMIGLELVRPGHGAELMDRLRGLGVVALASGPAGESLSITPALTIGADELTSALSHVKRALG
jgi:4-aminobutyrate aminotransferase/(S)-3-amino-2-methylpropionate transaminase